MGKETQNEDEDRALGDFDELSLEKLYELSGGLASLTLARQNRFSNKSTSSSNKSPIKWEWKPLKNPARSDDMVSWHWVSSATPKNDPDWTRQETDVIFSLCYRYDLKWFVVADRYMDSLRYFVGDSKVPLKDRCVDDIKDRYYTVLRLLSKARGRLFQSSGDLDGETLPPEVYQFNKSKELERKANLMKLYNRTPDQIKNEEVLYMELCLRNQLHSEFEKNREALCKFLGGLDLSHPNTIKMTQLVKHATQYNRQEGVSSTVIKPTKKKRKTLVIDDPTSSVQSSSYGELSPNSVCRTNTCSRAEDIQSSSNSGITPHTLVKGDYVSSGYHKYPIGVFARSSRIMLVKSSIAAKVEQVMNDNNIPLKPLYPTKECCDKYNDLKALVQTFVKFKKHADRLTSEYKKISSKISNNDDEPFKEV